MNIEIEALRDRLYKLIDREKTVASNEILKVSKELDALMVGYYKEKLGNLKYI